MSSDQNPYEITPKAPLNEVDTDPQATLKYAGFWIRVAAAIIDTIVILIITLPVLFAIYGSGYWSSPELVKGPSDILINYLFPLVFSIVLWMKIGGTPGKRLLGLKVLSESTQQYVSAGQGVLRYVGYFVAMLPLFLGLIWVAFDKKKKGLHDYLAGTVVVYD
jgi:uncharacterized RDD family membrane protein YckC